MAGDSSWAGTFPTRDPSVQPGRPTHHRGYAAATLGNLIGMVATGYPAYRLIQAFPPDLGIRADSNAGLADLAFALFAILLVYGLIIAVATIVGGVIGTVIALRVRKLPGSGRTAWLLMGMQLLVALLVAFGAPLALLMVATPLLARHIALRWLVSAEQ